MEDDLRHNPNFSRLLRGCRRSVDRTQQQLAETLGITKGSVANWETGTAKPSAEHFRQLLIELPHLAKVLAAPARVIMGWPAIGSKCEGLEKPEKTA